MILPGHHLKKVIENTVGEGQFQPAGVDLTVGKIYSFSSCGKIDFDNSERKISDTEEVEFKEDWVYLPKGTYKVVFNEIIRIPEDLMGLVLPRSSLLRSGASIHSAVWDPGYEGKGITLLVVHNEYGLKLKKNAKIGQIVFAKMHTNPEKTYNGTYKGENL